MNRFHTRIIVIRLLAFMLCSTALCNAYATSCMPIATLDESNKSFDIKQVRKELQADLATIPLMATARVETLSNDSYSNFLGPPVKIARVKIQSFIRQPLRNSDGSLDPGRDLNVTLVNSQFSKGDKILFFAYPETEEEFQTRINPNRNWSPSTGGFPSLSKQRLWHAVSACYATAYKINSKPAKLLLKEISEIGKLANQSGSLNLQVFELGNYAQMKPRGTLDVTIESLAANRKRYTLKLDVAKGGSLQLPSGRYQIQWPTLSGLKKQCYTRYVPNACFVQVHGGLVTYSHVVFTGEATLGLMMVDNNNKPISFFGELALVPLKTQANYSSGPVSITPLSNITGSIDKNSYEAGYQLREGLYQLELSVRHFDPKKKYSCDLLREKTYILPIKQFGVDAQWASSIRISAGRSLLLAKIPADIPLATIKLTTSTTNELQGEITPRCANFYYSRWAQTLKPSAQVRVPTGMQISISRICYACKPSWTAPVDFETSKDLRISLGDVIEESKSQ
jgi:hypothetical protein